MERKTYKSQRSLNQS